MKENYESQDLSVGEFIIFDGALKHGNKVNVENFCRVSFDFRIIRSSEFKNLESKSVTQNIQFSIGNYYSEYII